MILVNKKIGETPLQLIDRIRNEKPILKKETMSYAGRLDPMAEGEMLILVGDEENKNRHKYMGFDKEYVATFLVGVSTDSGDVLGLIGDKLHESKYFMSESVSDRKIIYSEIYQKIVESVNNLPKIKEQKYPWFSGKTVNGKKLFDHYKNSNFDIERPSQVIEIKNVEFTGLEIKKSDEVFDYIKNNVNLVSGDFRQSEILNKWNDFFDAKSFSIFIFNLKLTVSSGTFIRGLTENFPFPTTLLKLNRTKIIMQI